MTQRFALPGTYAEGARVRYDPRGDDDRYPWTVDSTWYWTHNGERYRNDQVWTREEYDNERNSAHPARR
jgi:hypothetical protein